MCILCDCLHFLPALYLLWLILLQGSPLSHCCSCCECRRLWWGWYCRLVDTLQSCWPLPHPYCSLDDGRSPVMILTQELVRGKKMLIAGKAVLVSWPPTTSKFPLRLAAVESINGVSGRVFQTDDSVVLLHIAQSHPCTIYVCIMHRLTFSTKKGDLSLLL